MFPRHSATLSWKSARSCFLYGVNDAPVCVCKFAAGILVVEVCATGCVLLATICGSHPVQKKQYLFWCGEAERMAALNFFSMSRRNESRDWSSALGQTQRTGASSMKTVRTTNPIPASPKDLFHLFCAIELSG